LGVGRRARITRGASASPAQPGSLLVPGPTADGTQPRLVIPDWGGPSGQLRLSVGRPGRTTLPQRVLPRTSAAPLLRTAARPLLPAAARTAPPSAGSRRGRAAGPGPWHGRRTGGARPGRCEVPKAEECTGVGTVGQGELRAARAVAGQGDAAPGTSTERPTRTD